MKLRLEAQGEITVLCVTESVSPSDPAVLRAGLAKLQQSGKRILLLDLTQADPASLSINELHPALSAVQSQFFAAGGQLAIASPVPILGETRTREEALALLASPTGKLLALEGKLKSLIQALKGQKGLLEKRLADTTAAGDEARKLRQDNSSLRAMIHAIEETVTAQKSARAEPLAQDPSISREKKVRKALDQALNGKAPQ